MVSFACGNSVCEGVASVYTFSNISFSCSSVLLSSSLGCGSRSDLEAYWL